MHFLICSILGVCSASESILECGDLESVDSKTLDCHHQEGGCLFNLEEDPCEQKDVGDENSEIRDKMIERLDFYEERSVTPLVTMEDRLEWDEYDPMKQSNSNFWSPFMEYKDVAFEHTLRAQYGELYPLADADGKNEMVLSFLTSSNGVQSEDTSMDIDNALTVVFAISLLMSICALIWIHRNHSDQDSQRVIESVKLHRETAPLMDSKQ